MNQVLILGRRRQGKSTLALALAASKGSVVIYDPNGVFSRYATTSAPDRILTELEKGRERVIVFRPRFEFKEDDFEALCLVLWPLDSDKPRFQDYSIIVDEASCIQTPSRIHPQLERLLRLAPRDVLIIQTAHRLVDTHRLSRALATDVFLFHNGSGKDLELIATEFESEDLRNAVAGLGEYEVAHYTILQGGKRAFWVWKRPGAWYLPLEEDESIVREGTYGRPAYPGTGATATGRTETAVSSAI